MPQRRFRIRRFRLAGCPLALERLVCGIASLACLVALAQQLAPRQRDLVAVGFGRLCPGHRLSLSLDRLGSLGIRAVLGLDRPVALPFGFALTLDSDIALATCICCIEARRVRPLTVGPLCRRFEHPLDDPLAPVDCFVPPAGADFAAGEAELFTYFGVVGVLQRPHDLGAGGRRVESELLLDALPPQAPLFVDRDRKQMHVQRLLVEVQVRGRDDRLGLRPFLEPGEVWSCPSFADTYPLGEEEESTMPKSRPPYPAAFRQQMVELVRSGRAPGELAREFEPSAEAIRNWVAQADRDVGKRSDGLRTEEHEEIRRLRRENRRLREEREILAKATAWFARETGSGRSTGS